MDREKVIKEAERIMCSTVSRDMIDSFCEDVIALLKEQESKTGYWIDSAGNDKCSICGTEYSDLYPDYGNTHFCPNCGAKMEGR